MSGVHRRRCVPGWLVLLLLLLHPTAAAAGDELDVQDWLARPGVKLLVVEFFAPWCQPCVAAIPQWQALQTAHRQHGLRLVVVSVQAGGQCLSPGWMPDQVVCDDDGALQRRFGVAALPQAFLLSWNGTRLVEHGTVEQVVAGVERFLAEAPRIQLDPVVDPEGRPVAQGAALRVLIQDELRRQAKFDLVADPREQARLLEELRRSHGDTFQDGGQCRIGEALPPNSLLRPLLTRPAAGALPWLNLNLFSLASGCLLASARARYSAAAPEQAVVEAVDGLIRQLTGERDAAPRTAPMVDPIVHEAGPTTAALPPPPRSEPPPSDPRPSAATAATEPSRVPERRAPQPEPASPRSASSAKPSIWINYSWYAALMGTLAGGYGAYSCLAGQTEAREATSVTALDQANSKIRMGNLLMWGGIGAATVATTALVLAGVFRDDRTQVTQVTVTGSPDGLGLSWGGRF